MMKNNITFSFFVNQSNYLPLTKSGTYDMIKL